MLLIISAKGIKYLFPVQVETYKKVLEGEDTIAKARTGTGKTVSYNGSLRWLLGLLCYDGDYRGYIFQLL